MEYTQWVRVVLIRRGASRLNPCCNGIYSMSNVTLSMVATRTCLNPCCNGIYSMRNNCIYLSDNPKES